jgi:hypothetical protein
LLQQLAADVCASSARDAVDDEADCGAAKLIAAKLMSAGKNGSVIELVHRHA